MFDMRSSQQCVFRIQFSELWHSVLQTENTAKEQSGYTGKMTMMVVSLRNTGQGAARELCVGQLILWTTNGEKTATVR